MTDLTRFDSNSIVFENNPNPKPPSNSNSIKVFQRNGDLFKIDFSGRVTPLNTQEVSYYQTTVEADADAASFTFTLPNPNKIVKELDARLSSRIEQLGEGFVQSFNELQKALGELEATQSSINSIQTELESIVSDLETKVAQDEFSSRLDELQTSFANDLLTIVGNLETSIALRVTRQELEAALAGLDIPPEITVAEGRVTQGDSAGLSVRKEGTTYFIDVEFPETSSREIVSTGGGGISRAAVKRLIQESVVSGKPLTSPDGSVTITETPDEWQLTVDTSAISGGSGFTPIAGEGILVTPVGSDYEFSVDDYISSSEVASISGDLQTQIDSSLSGSLSDYTLLTTTSAISGDLQNQIDNIVQEGTSINSSDGTINVDQTLLNFDLTVNDYISASEVASISGSLSNAISLVDSSVSTVSGDLNELTLIVNGISGDYVTSSDLVNFITSTEVANLSGDLQSQINSNDIDIANIVAASGDWLVSSDLTQIENDIVSLSGAIDAIEQEATVIESSGGSILVTQDGNTWNLEVASAPIQDHNDLNGLQGGTTGEYYHLSESQFNDYISGSEVASISGGLDSRITVIESDYLVSSDLDSYITTTEVASVSGDLQDQIDNIVQEGTSISSSDGTINVDQSLLNFDLTVDDYISATTVASISGNLQDQIDAIEEEATVVLGDGDRITVAEAPANNWTVSFDATGLATSDDVNVLSGSYATYSYVDAADTVLQNQITNNTSDIANLVTEQRETDEPTGFANTNLDSNLSVVDGTRTLTFTPDVSGSVVYVKGNRYNFTTAQQVTWSNLEGNHFFTIDIDGNLQSNHVSDFSGMEEIINHIIRDNAFVAEIYWDSINNRSLLFDERHGCTMDSATHYWLHQTQGTQYISGLGLAANTDENGNLDSHAQFSGTLGRVLDEDVFSDISAKALTGDHFVLYKEGAVGTWRWIKSSAPILTAGTGRAAYNEITAGTASVVEAGNNNFVLGHVFAGPIKTDSLGYFTIIGQNEYGNLSAAQEGATVELSSLILDGLALPEFVPVATFIIQTGNAYLNTWKSRIRTTDSGEDFINWIGTETFSSAGAVNTHNNLAGLQGGTVGEYFHLTAAEYSDYIGSTEVASISGGLDSRITAIENDYLVSSDLDGFITTVEVASISGSLQTQIDSNDLDIANLVAASGDYATYSYVDAVSGSLGGFAQETRDFVVSNDGRLDSLEAATYVNSIEGLTGAVEVSGGSDIGVTVDGQTINISYTGTSGGNFVEKTGDTMTGKLTIDMSSGDRFTILDAANNIGFNVQEGAEPNTLDMTIDGAIYPMDLIASRQIIAAQGIVSLSYVEASSFKDTSLTEDYFLTVDATGEIVSSPIQVSDIIRVDAVGVLIDSTGQRLPRYDTESFITITEVASISGDLQTQIDAISGGGSGSVTTLIGGDGINVTESPIDTWTVAVDGTIVRDTEFNQLQADVNDLTTTVASISGGSGGSVSIVEGVSIGVTESPTDTFTINFEPAAWVIATTNAGQVTSATRYNVIYEDVDYDKGSNYNTTTGIFTAPVGGLYFVSASIGSANTTMNTGQRSILELFRNGSQRLQSEARYYVGFSGGTQAIMSSLVCGMYPLSAGDTLEVTALETLASTSLITNPDYNRLSIIGPLGQP